MIALNLSTAVAALAIANGLFLLVGVIRRLVFSPLRNVPGPKIAAATGIWLWLEDMRGTAPGSIKALHAKYGKVEAPMMNWVLTECQATSSELDLKRLASMTSRYTTTSCTAKLPNS